MMERTEIREAFFAEVKNDPYGHMITQMLSRMWAEGYEQALRDAEELLLVGGDVEGFRRRKSFGQRCEDAIEFMTDSRKKAEMEAIIALASLGPLMSRATWTQ